MRFSTWFHSIELRRLIKPRSIPGVSPTTVSVNVCGRGDKVPVNRMGIIRKKEDFLEVNCTKYNLGMMYTKECQHIWI